MRQKLNDGIYTGVITNKSSKGITVSIGGKKVFVPLYGFQWKNISRGRSGSVHVEIKNNRVRLVKPSSSPKKVCWSTVHVTEVPSALDLEVLKIAKLVGKTICL